MATSRLPVLLRSYHGRHQLISSVLTAAPLGPSHQLGKWAVSVAGASANFVQVRGSRMKQRHNPPFHAWTKKRRERNDQELTEDNHALINKVIYDKYEPMHTPETTAMPFVSPLKQILQARGVWKSSTTLLQVVNNHGIKCISPEVVWQNYGSTFTRKDSGCSRSSFGTTLLAPPQSSLIAGLTCTPPLFTESTRNVTKFSRGKGRRKTVCAVKKRFYRLDWGAWISPLPGRNRHLWKKTVQCREFLKNHVFRSNLEVKLLEKMVTKYWVKKKYFVNDPYESYHTRDNFRVTKGVQGVDSTLLHQAPRSYTIRKNSKR